jgi:hypothetical protein
MTDAKSFITTQREQLTGHAYLVERGQLGGHGGGQQQQTEGWHPWRHALSACRAGKGPERAKKRPKIAPSPW